MYKMHFKIKVTDEGGGHTQNNLNSIHTIPIHF